MNEIAPRNRRFSKEEKFSQIISFEGYLNKLSPQFLIGFQKRFFCVRDGGHKLIYYKTKPVLKDKPKGMLEIKDITNLLKKSKTDFSFQYEERKFELRARDEAECDKWLFSIEFLKGYLTSLENKRSENQQMRVSIGGFDKKKKKWRINNLESHIFNDIQAEHEINIINSTDSSVTNPLDDYNRILTLKGITDFTDKLDPKVVQSRLCVGFLSKKGKNNITRYQKRFFVLISAKPLNNEIKDDIILTENDLPPWLELETIYYFHCKHDEDKSPFVGKIALRNCISITMEDNQHECVLTSLKKDFLDFSCNLIKIKELFSWEANLGLTKPENGFGFKLTTNDRTYNFYSDLITEMNKWIIAIEQSQRNYKELHPNFKRDSIEINDVSPRKKVKTIGIKRTKTEVSDVVSNISFESMSQPLVKPTIMAKEGYLHKKTINKLQKLIGWKQRYVCLKDENIFWVASNTLTDNPRAVIAIKTIEKCQSHKENKFFLEINQKKYKFKAETEDDRDKWVQIINKARNIVEEEKPKPKFLVSSGFENNHYSINSNNIDQMSLEPLKLNAITQPTQQDEVEDSIFSRFYALTDHNARPNSIKKITDPKAKPNSIQKKEEFSPKKRNSSPTKPPGCFSKLFCCFKKTPESEEDYYSQL